MITTVECDKKMKTIFNDHARDENKSESGGFIYLRTCWRLRGLMCLGESAEFVEQVLHCAHHPFCSQCLRCEENRLDAAAFVAMMRMSEL